MPVDRVTTGETVQITGTEFDDWAPFRPVRIFAGEYAIHSKGAQTMFYVVGAAFAEWICLKLNTRTPYGEGEQPEQKSVNEETEHPSGSG